MLSGATGLVGTPSLSPRPLTALLGLVVGLIMLGGVFVALHRSRVRQEAETLRLRDEIALKDRQLSMVSRHLREPLAAVLGLANELDTRWRSFSPAERTEFIRIISHQAAAVASVVDDLLVTARTEIGSDDLRLEAVDAASVAVEVATMVGGASRRSIPVKGSGGSVRADSGRLRQILRNLLTNAVSHGGDKAWVEVWERDGSVAVIVCDNGTGVPAELVERLFDPDLARERHRPAGLGLAASRRLARLMGGDLTYWKRPHSTCFMLTLPVARASKAA